MREGAGFMKKQEKIEEKPVEHDGIRMILSGKGDAMTLYAEDVGKLLLCLPNAVRLLLRKEIVSVSGKSLACTTYAHHAVEIVGRIDEIRLEGREG